MFAITFDLIIANVKRKNPKGVNRAYEENRRTLGKHGSVWKQGSVYINPDGGLVELLQALNALKASPGSLDRSASYELSVLRTTPNSPLS